MKRVASPIYLLTLGFLSLGSLAFGQNFSKESPFVNTLGMKFVPLPGTGVAFGVHEVSREQFMIFSNSSQFEPSSERKAGKPDSWQNLRTEEGFTQLDSHPVVNVSWKAANQFCKWLSTREGLSYRLPTDYEWSIAVGLIGESKFDTPSKRYKEAPRAYYWGTRWPPNQPSGNFADANYKSSVSSASTFSFNDGFSGTSPIGSYQRNVFGIYDLDGNVAEWVHDWYDANKTKTVRGVSYRTVASKSKDTFLTGYRAKSNPFEKSDAIGFRVVISTEDDAVSDDSLPASSYPTPSQLTSSGGGSTSKPNTSTPSYSNNSGGSSSSSSSTPTQLVYVTHPDSAGIRMRVSSSKSANTLGTIHNQYDVVLKQTDGPKWEGSTQWAKIEASGWMPVKVDSSTYLKKEGNNWRVVWNQWGDNYVSMRSGTSSGNKLIARVNYGSVVEEIETRWVGSRQYVHVKFVGWAARTDGGQTFIVNKIY